MVNVHTGLHSNILSTNKSNTSHFSFSAHLGRGCDPQVCSSASLPAAGALCTEVVDHEKPHGGCSEIHYKEFNADVEANTGCPGLSQQTLTCQYVIMYV